MKIIVSSRAKKELRKIPKIDQIAVTRKISSLIENSIINEVKLSGFKDIFRARIGNYRIVYRKTSQEIHIVLIHHRKDVYRIVNQLLK
ncbi:type II toxin-antitoxin system mRNA interferase toxin, RelE/StbE family [Candidatus Roizmanbacteria bacterium CG_4_9_14_3_um_filter_33_18]|uniref:Type II toxin-antitoxin system mRNA interferase toxin, RelE/StbE family n=3 Tax=Candidatus Roizmaniibacteriota TaxID=1752723 RepID=A0A2M7U9C2_9BACT|nr:MAG: type II toxin-antitoxin system mRNA interferase toxin, RelE/StbE family [Candidatus Roizmanbacteria bacterium CG22_combo_CG10-13_8_21_14_all_34_12]PIZ67830.1 MAG: type II toxin-antitoxin system mRNA interferase toxin, RelE/StbE family [Candidatus Roizmanbacteria bacterium CG_4_10_14_0_2_um_filter_33_96]PJA55315.1 MAG: type II toxin-antitoxin system mRNA interferase toxin, RelE/StbE family [Candidatus Roizmanbacteria bacterium CG_4_9_14_3_um_filter_33_18]